MLVEDRAIGVRFDQEGIGKQPIADPLRGPQGLGASSAIAWGPELLERHVRREIGWAQLYDGELRLLPATAQ